MNIVNIIFNASFARLIMLMLLGSIFPMKAFATPCLYLSGKVDYHSSVIAFSQTQNGQIFGAGSVDGTHSASRDFGCAEGNESVQVWMIPEKSGFLQNVPVSVAMEVFVGVGDNYERKGWISRDRGFFVGDNRFDAEQIKVTISNTTGKDYVFDSPQSIGTAYLCLGTSTSDIGFDCSANNNHAGFVEITGQGTIPALSTCSISVPATLDFGAVSLNKLKSGETSEKTAAITTHCQGTSGYTVQVKCGNYCSSDGPNLTTADDRAISWPMKYEGSDVSVNGTAGVLGFEKHHPLAMSEGQTDTHELTVGMKLNPNREQETIEAKKYQSVLTVTVSPD